MPIRRAADPNTVQHVWDAIRSANLQHQMADSKRIVKYLQKVDNCTNAQAELYIQQTISDGLIVALQKITKTSKGDMVDSYRIPTNDTPPLDGKDWYCFECHLGGDVATCATCFRVFHAECINNGRKRYQEFNKTNVLYDFHNKSTSKDDSNISNSTNVSTDGLNASSDLSTYKLPLNNNDSNVAQVKDDAYDETLCSVCNIAKLHGSCNLDNSELNYLLKFVLHRIQSWLPNTITHTMAAEERPEWQTDKELTWRSHQLFFEHRDMSVIEVILNSERYTQLHQFLADVLTIQHNVAIFHGIESQEYAAAELMLRDCLHDLTELRLCVDCYRHSNEKINSKWFCLPCRVPHKLVWAKQKGYPYWPAKVIQESETHFDVRFFGGKYERSLLARAFIKPIETLQSKPQNKTTAAFNKAVEELKLHQKLLENPDELEKLISSSKQGQRVLKRPRFTPIKNDARQNSFESNDVYKFEDIPYVQENMFPQERRNKRKKSTCYEGGSPMKRNTNEGESEEELLKVSDNIIHISDGEEDKFVCSETYPVADCNGSYEQGSSQDNSLVNKQQNGMQHPYSESFENIKRRLESLCEKRESTKGVFDSVQNEIEKIIEKITEEHNDHLKRLFEVHNSQISEIKKKQWCFNCEQEAIYHCCWNTAYCSQSCQQQHWQAEHKRVCRRKR